MFEVVSVVTGDGVIDEGDVGKVRQARPEGAPVDPYDVLTKGGGARGGGGGRVMRSGWRGGATAEGRSYSLGWPGYWGGWVTGAVGYLKQQIHDIH